MDATQREGHDFSRAASGLSDIGFSRGACRQMRHE